MATCVASSALCLRFPTVTPPQRLRHSCRTSNLAVSQPFSGAHIRGFGSQVGVPPSSSSSSSGSVAEEEKLSTSFGSEGSAVGENEAEVSNSQSRIRSVSPKACQACGKEEKVGGCNGEGRILGGLGSVPGFGWFPIKAYRPCPAFVEAGGRYKRQGQSLEEVAFGRMGNQDSLDITERLQGGKKQK